MPQSQLLSVFRSRDLIGIDGVCDGDQISFADDLLLDDCYALTPSARRAGLLVGLGPRLQTLRVIDGSELGTPGQAIHIDSCLTFMDTHGSINEVLILVAVDQGMASDVFVLPLGEMDSAASYRLVRVDRTSATRRFAELACVSFARGTHITMATGQQRPIEDLSIGDMVLTRDNGARPVRWIGKATLRATGIFAPVCFAPGVLNNHRALTVSPDHRLMVYQRHDALGAGHKEILIKARHLVNGTTVTQREGGFVEYYQILLEDHELIYAEGIASESLLVNAHTSAAIPEDIARPLLSETAPVKRPVPHYEVAETLLTAPDTVSLLKLASTG